MFLSLNFLLNQLSSRFVRGAYQAAGEAKHFGSFVGYFLISMSMNTFITIFIVVGQTYVLLGEKGVATQG